MSYSGFKTAVINFLQKSTENPSFIEENLADLCASIQYTLIEIIFEKIKLAVDQTGLTEIAIGGGVAANSGLRTKLKEAATQYKWMVHLPPFATPQIMPR